MFHKAMRVMNFCVFSKADLPFFFFSLLRRRRRLLPLGVMRLESFNFLKFGIKCVKKIIK